jgi:hypothetical protein
VRLGGVTLLLLSLVGCRQNVHLTLPDHRSAETLLFASWRAPATCGAADPDQDYDLRVFSPPSSYDAATPFALPDPSRVAAVFYTRPPHALGLSDGDGRKQDCIPGGHPLPAGDAMFDGLVKAGAFDGWVAQVALPSGLEGYRTAGTETSTPCVSAFVDHIVSLPGASGPGMNLIALSGEEALASTADGGLYRVRSSGATRLTVSSTRPVVGLHRTPSGTVWLAYFDGNLTELDASLVSPVRTTRAPFALPYSLAGPRDSSAAFELFAGSSDGRFARFDGTAWSAPISTNTASNTAHLVWVAPGEVVLVHSHRPEVFRYRQGQVAPETVDEAVRDYAAAEWIAPFGVVLSASLLPRSERYFFIFDADRQRWLRLGYSGISTANLYSLTKFQDGLAFCGGEGFWGQFTTTSGRSCPTVPLEASLDATVALSDRTLLIASNMADRGAPGVHWMTAPQ